LPARDLPRTAKLETRTKETRIEVRVNLDGTGRSHISTGIRFFDHMISSFATHSLIDINIRARGDLRHHIVEDCAIALGKCIGMALDAREGILRFGSSFAPMDESLAFAAVDLVKRNYCVLSNFEIRRNVIEDLPKEDIVHFFRSFSNSLNCTTHIRLEYGSNDHHKIEACFKALALAMRRAIEKDPRRRMSSCSSVPSSKGVM
jgi:imidazoleglycerol-phosphate dehydratase